MRIFHIATVADWQAAQETGRYTTSTRGRTLAEEGFIHASRGDQWQAVRTRWYSDVTEPLVLLVIDSDLLGSPVIDEEVPGTGETFPHVYGPIEVGAVIRTIALADELPTQATYAEPQRPQDPPSHGQDPSASFSRLFLEEMFRNVALASIVMVVVVVGTVVGLEIDDQWGPLVGALVGLVIGVVVVRRIPRRTDA